MHLGSIYIVVNDFEKSVAFYEKLLAMPLSGENNGRYASFYFEGHCISILNGHFDVEYPEKVIKKGARADWFDDWSTVTNAPNTHKFAFNFWAEDLREEYARIKSLDITGNLSEINYLCYVAPYYYFCLTDPDGNMIEVTGGYTPEEGEFDDRA